MPELMDRCFSGKEVEMKREFLNFVPKTGLGKCSVMLIIAMPIFFALGSSFANSLYRSVPSGNTILADIMARPALALTMLTGMAAGVAAFVTGSIAMFKQKDNTHLVCLATILSALFVMFLIGEIAFPH